MKLRCAKKLYGIIFLLVFLSAQASIILHTAEHGVLEHSHVGEQCEQCIFAKHYNADIPDAEAVNIVLFDYGALYAIFSQVLTSKAESFNNFARAPPFISFS